MMEKVMEGLTNILYLRTFTMKVRSFLASAVGRGDWNQHFTY